MRQWAGAAENRKCAGTSDKLSSSNAPEIAPDRPIVPEEMSADRKIAFLLLILSIGYLWLFRRYTFMEPDEGIVLQGAQRILRGQVLYRDFFSFFTPGSYYFLALLFKVFGNSFLVARTALVFLGGICSAITYLLARRVCSRVSALLIAVVVTITALPYRFEVLHNWDSTLWACLAVYFTVRWLESQWWAWAFAAGSFAGLAFLFEQPKGAGLMFGLGGGLAVITLFDRNRSLWTRRQTLALVVGIAWPLFLTFGYFFAQHSISAMFADWLWPMQHYSLANKVPFGYQNWSESTRHILFHTGSFAVRLITIVAVSPCFLVPLLSVLAVGLLSYWIFQMRLGRRPMALCAHYVLVSAALSGLLLSVVIVRADVIHFMYLQPLFLLVLAWMVDGRDIPGQIFAKLRPFLNLYFAIAFLLFTAPLLIRSVSAKDELQTRRGSVKLPAKDTVVEYIEAHVAPGGSLFIYPYLPLYYYLTNTVNPTRYEYFQPGMHTTGQAREMLDDLVRSRVPVVLYEISFWEKIPNSWPGTPLSAVAHDEVADYIMKNYRPCALLQSPSDWRFMFMVRKDLECP